MQTADFNHNDFQNVQEADKALLVRFFYHPQEDKQASLEKGYPVICRA